MDLMVATDFSPHGKAVLRVARRLGQALGARIRVVHVATPGGGRALHGGGAPGGGAAVADDVREEARLVEEAAAALRESGLEATGLLVEGPPVRTLLEEAGRLEADMIVVGSHGYGAVARALLGSVSAGVVRHATCPVLVVPARRTEQ
jgi:nucleotide-binding universal stress UspA family protein